ncbi:MAG: hypothetical protein AB8B32_09050, partial [Prochlorococcus sp.]
MMADLMQTSNNKTIKQLIESTIEHKPAYAFFWPHNRQLSRRAPQQSATPPSDNPPSVGL